MAPCLKRALAAHARGLCMRAIGCVLLLGACRVYDRDAISSRVSATQSESAHAVEGCLADAACAEAGCGEQCNGLDDDCDGFVDEGAAASCQLAHADAVCREGQCQLARCAEGYRDCDGEADNGCEVEPDSIEHCGQCERHCDVDHGNARCVDGQCELSECQEGFADCDQDGRSCEVALAHEVDHCGSCERHCLFAVESPHATAQCNKGSCAPQCEHGFGDCDGVFENGCERSLQTAADCGGCGKACAIEHASAQCKSGRCELQACEPGYADCDADSLSCERSLSDVPSCGACDQRCQPPHATAHCSEQAAGAHGCEIERCDAGYSNCDGSVDNGCERDVRPVADGGDGPCVPDANCERESFQERQYFFCSGARAWDSARAACKSQRNGDLAQLRDAATQDFLHMHVTGHVWIGHNDLVAQGVWIWANTNVPFWRGGLNGRVQNNAFVSWSPTEPDGSGRCGSLTASAQMEDLACTVLQPFVCEISPDLCPDDPKKSHPGQCGCGKPDTDANQDGLAECP